MLFPSAVSQVDRTPGKQWGNNRTYRGQGQLKDARQAWTSCCCLPTAAQCMQDTDGISFPTAIYPMILLSFPSSAHWCQMGMELPVRWSQQHSWHNRTRDGNRPSLLNLQLT